MMKKITYLLTGVFLFVAVNGVKAQASQECNIKYNLFKGDVTNKKYDGAKPHLEYLLTNCPSLSVNIYKYGDKVAENSGDHALAKRIYEGRLKHFPKKNPAKVHGDYANYLYKNKLAGEDEIFVILDKAFKLGAKNMGVKNILRYFELVTDKYKDSDPQKVFDTYDDAVESVQEKLDDYSKRLALLVPKEEAGTLTSKEKRKLKAARINSTSLGQVEGGLDGKISEIATCERLVPIYTRDFDSKKTDGVWLRRAVSRMYNKGCQDDPLFEKLAAAYADVTQSADAFNFVAGVLEKNGDKKAALNMRKKAFDLETDPIKKAKLKLREAQDAHGSRARSLALEALKYNPNYGKAYLYIASLYAKSANSCGSDVFEKRMVYVAALNKAQKAQKVDPGCGAARYVRNYRANMPTKKLIFQKGVASGSSHKISCWIGETVRVP